MATMKSMKNNEKFRYSLNQTLLSMFKVMFIDAAEGEILNRIGYYAVVGYLMTSFAATFNGMFFTHADSVTILMGGCNLAGSGQVNPRMLS